MTSAARGHAVALRAIALSLACAACAACGNDDVSTAVATSAAAPPKPAHSASAAAAKGAAAPGSSASDADPCASSESWKPAVAKVAFAWAEGATLDKAPRDGVYAFLGGKTEPFAVTRVEIRIDKQRKEWTLKAESGPVGPSILFTGDPKVGETVTNKFGTGNRGYYQVPKADGFPRCFKQTTSYSGENGRVVKLTKLDEKAKVADGSFVSVWRESLGGKREMWAAGTFKDAKVVILD